MATESNNIQTNSFGKGMNTDASLDIIQEGQYVFGQNIRITGNTMLGQIVDSNSTEGVLTPVEAGKNILQDESFKDIYKILATGSLEEIGVVIFSKKYSEDKFKWFVYRLKFDESTIRFKEVFQSEELDEVKDKFSIVLNRELEDVVKVYIADGVHQLMQINLLDDEYNEKITGNTDNITSNKLFPASQVKIKQQVAGQLKTSQVQYTYRLYKKYGISSRMAPVTNKIQIIDDNRNKEEGNAQNTTTSKGLQIEIPLSDLTFNKEVFDHIQIFRMQYINPQQDANVDMIYDSFIKDYNLTITDDGTNSLKRLSVDELASLNSMILIPQNLEQNQNYMFISNVEDKTIMRMEDVGIDSKTYQRRTDGKFILRNNDDPYNDQNTISTEDVNEISEGYNINPGSIMNYTAKDWENCKYMLDKNSSYYFLGGEGKNVNWRFVTTNIITHDKFDPYSPIPPHVTGGKTASPIYYIRKGNGGQNELTPSNFTTNDYLSQHGITAMNSLEYGDIIGSSMFRSLRRDDVYRYGIVYYDKYGKRSDVQWIGDFRTPAQKDLSSSYGNSQLDTTESYDSQAVTLDASFRFVDVSAHDNYILQGWVTYEKAESNRVYIDDDSTIQLNIQSAEILGPKTIDMTKGIKIGPDLYKCDIIPTVSLCVKTVKGVKKYDLGPFFNKNVNQSINVAAGSELYLEYGGVYIDKYKFNTHFTDSKPDRNVVNNNKEDSGIDVSSNAIVTTDMYKLYYPYKDNGVDAANDVDKAYYKFCESYAHVYVIDKHYNSYDINAVFNIKIIANTQRLLKQTYQLTDLNARPLGIQFDINVPESSGISQYQIVRCSKQKEYSETVMQCALSRPIRQQYVLSTVGKKLRSPYYPTPFLTSQYTWVQNYLSTDAANGNENSRLFQLHSSEITLFDEDSLSLIHKNDSKILPVSFNYQDQLSRLGYALSGYKTQQPSIFSQNKYQIGYDRYEAYASGKDGNVAIDFKTGSTCNMYLYNTIYNFKTGTGNVVQSQLVDIEEVSKVQVPNWESGFTNVNLEANAAVKAYKGYVSTVKTDEYVNWVANGMYDMQISDVFRNGGSRGPVNAGWIGPGPQCILIRTGDSGHIFGNSITGDEINCELTLGTLVCDVKHTATQFAGFTEQEKQFDIYYGFGNFGKLTPDGTGNMKGSIIVFDGDIYNLPCELVSMYKTYNFMSTPDTLPSAQVVNYVPLETKINTFFDYGMNYINTQSPNLQFRPGEITGISSQDRPQHQYNPIYSDNNVSNDVYNAQSEEASVNIYNQRIFYSQLKTNGEYVDKWSDFRALDYIDANTRYGKITHMLTNKDILYFWQSKAFGKLSVNERSLVTDNNNNTIQLGQGGVLQRTDYLSTYYGLREDDRSAISTKDGVFWIDAVNKAILMSDGSNVLNYAERLNVQNVLNERMTDDRPHIEYDTQNDELLCKCLSNGDQLVFNTKMNCATSIYTRDYDDTINYNNKLYGISVKNKPFVTQYNYLNSTDNYLSPTVFSFVVNKLPSTTKVFDNQSIVTLKRDYDQNYTKTFMQNKMFEFTTNLDESSYEQSNNEIITDREGNICYTIPRSNDRSYGNRLRGKWLKVTMTDFNPKEDYAISHILTKFRQSFN